MFMLNSYLGEENLSTKNLSWFEEKLIFENLNIWNWQHATSSRSFPPIFFYFVRYSKTKEPTKNERKTNGRNPIISHSKIEYVQRVYKKTLCLLVPKKDISSLSPSPEYFTIRDSFWKRLSRLWLHSVRSKVHFHLFRSESWFWCDILLFTGNWTEWIQITYCFVIFIYDWAYMDCELETIIGFSQTLPYNTSQWQKL